jgi:lipoprotein-anchoring transpeptidase ErfK/SrfK
VIKVGDEALAEIELAALIMPVGRGRLGHGIQENCKMNVTRGREGPKLI